MRALDTWPTRGVPDEPLAWLITVARNALASHFRRLPPQPVDPATINLEAGSGATQSPDAAAIVGWGLARLAISGRNCSRRTASTTSPYGTSRWNSRSPSARSKAGCGGRAPNFANDSNDWRCRGPLSPATPEAEGDDMTTRHNRARDSPSASSRQIATEVRRRNRAAKAPGWIPRSPRWARARGRRCW